MTAKTRASNAMLRATLPGLVTVFAFLTASGCSWSRDSADAGPGGDESPTESSATGQQAARADRNASIYAAVIRRLVTDDHTFGGGDPGFRVVFVLDGALPGVAKPDGIGARDPKRPFSAALKDKLENELSDLPPLRFVGTESAATRGESSGGEVIPGGVLISLGPIVGGSSRVRVGNSLWLSGKGAQWLTYVVTRRTGGWRVTGTTGPWVVS